MHPTPSQPRSRSHQPPPLSKNFLLNLHLKDRQRFSPLATIHLESSCYNRFPVYRELVSSIVQFNQRLEKWQRGQTEIENLMRTYNVLSNLSMRLMGLRFMKDEEAVVREIDNVKKWYVGARAGEVAKEVGNISNILQALKNYKMEPLVDDHDNLPMYKQMSRTQHSQFRPPRQRLRQFKRRQLITPSTDMVQTMMTTKQTFFSDKPPTFDIRVNKTSQPFIVGLGDSSMKDTNLKSQQETTLASGEKEIINTQMQVETLENYEQEEEEEEEEQREEEQKEDPYKKAYTSDSLYKIPQQKAFVRTTQPATLFSQHRVLQTQKNQYHHKLIDDKDLNQIQQWRKLKSRHATQLTRRSQTGQEGNRFKGCSYQPSPNKVALEEEHIRKYPKPKPNKSQKVLRKKILLDDVSDEDEKKLKTEEKREVLMRVNTLGSAEDVKKATAQMKIGKLIEAGFPFPSDPTNPLSFFEKAKQIQNEIRQTRLTKTIKTYSKYIRHTSQSSERRQTQIHPQVSAFQQATLTGFQRNRSSSFGEILYRFHPQSYNLQNQNMVEKIKAALSSKGIPINGKTITNSLKIPLDHKYSQSDKLYKNGERLISNPWFPKNLGKKKKKKK